MNGTPLTLERFNEAMVSIDKRFEKVDFQFEKVNAQFVLIDSRFEQVDARFEQVNSRFEQVDAQFEQMVTRGDTQEGLIQLLVKGQESLLSETRDIKRRVVRLEYAMEDVQESLGILTDAEEKDAVATMNHEKRISDLEQIHKIKPITLSHLSDSLQ